ncbi:hypothetical protein Thivi_1737 [Thiocystis violascens DSM 198]|uniref:Uncharacterized protein n=1 Tax=Thiocystis violascens (strain ATCC 17096 / DSM 198 / 6111) TaxID=765911 RepID=I3Y9P3_THIV6|nr:hypothetical protein Thivi_1737 [Thiocystis violascens DSM 198]
MQPALGVADRLSALAKPTDSAGSPADSTDCKSDSPDAGCKPALPGALQEIAGRDRPKLELLMDALFFGGVRYHVGCRIPLNG